MRLIHSLSYTIVSIFVVYIHAESTKPNGSVDPPGLQPLIIKADAFLSSGQFTDAARAYTEALGKGCIL